MLKSAMKYTFLFHTFKKYQTKIYFIFSLAVIYLLIDNSYGDIHLYLAKAHPEFLMLALWVKSILVLILGIALLVCLKPKGAASSVNEPSKNDQMIIDQISHKPNLSSGEPIFQKEAADKPETDPQLNEDIIDKIRTKKNLESRADKLFNSYRNQ